MESSAYGHLLCPRTSSEVAKTVQRLTVITHLHLFGRQIIHFCCFFASTQSDWLRTCQTSCFHMRSVASTSGLLVSSCLLLTAWTHRPSTLAKPLKTSCWQTIVLWYIHQQSQSDQLRMHFRSLCPCCLLPATFDLQTINVCCKSAHSQIVRWQISQPQSVCRLFWRTVCLPT